MEGGLEFCLCLGGGDGLQEQDQRVSHIAEAVQEEEPGMEACPTDLVECLAKVSDPTAGAQDSS